MPTPPADALQAAINRQKRAMDAFDAAVLAAIPEGHPIRVELQQSSTDLDHMLFDDDCGDSEAMCST